MRSMEINNDDQCRMVLVCSSDRNGSNIVKAVLADDRWRKKWQFQLACITYDNVSLIAWKLGISIGISMSIRWLYY